MTWTGWPHVINIRCPHCSERAIYEYPFEFRTETPEQTETPPSSPWSGFTSEAVSARCANIRAEVSH